MCGDEAVERLREERTVLACRGGDYGCYSLALVVEVSPESDSSKETMEEECLVGSGRDT